MAKKDHIEEAATELRNLVLDEVLAVVDRIIAEPVRRDGAKSKDTRIREAIEAMKKKGAR